MCVATGKAGAKAAESKKNVKKTAVSKPNSIKSLFMNSNVKKPAEVCTVCYTLVLNNTFWGDLLS